MSTLKKSLQTLGSIAAVSGLIAATPVPATAQMANPCAPKAGKTNPCAPQAKKASAKKAANPCAPSAKRAANPCAPANPCAAKK